MDAKIQKQVIDYFSLFEEFYNASKTCLKICQNCASTINKIIIRCRKIRAAQIPGTPLEEFIGLQSKLIEALHNLVSVEIQKIKNNLSTLEELFEKLCNKHNILQGNCKDINFTELTPLVKGSPYQPPLQQLLNFADDTVTFGSQICSQIDVSLNVLSFKGLNTESLSDNFKISADWQRKIPEIIAYTSFCSENQI